jgi:hypothetical protein
MFFHRLNSETILAKGEGNTIGRILQTVFISKLCLSFDGGFKQMTGEFGFVRPPTSGVIGII